MKSPARPGGGSDGRDGHQDGQTLHACVDGFTGNRHGDPLPLSMPNSLGKLSSSAPRYLRRRRAGAACRRRRLRESVASVNSLSGPSVVGASRPIATPLDAPSPTQRVALEHLQDHIGRFPRDEAKLSDNAASTELPKTTDVYEQSVSTRAPFAWDKLKLLEGTASAAPLRDRLSGEAQVWYNSFDTSIERSEAVVEELRANGDLLSPEPYWDPTLAADPQLRLKF